MSDHDLCVCEGSSHKRMNNMSTTELLASLRASDNDMFYWFDLHCTSSEDVIWRLLALIPENSSSSTIPTAD